MQKVPPKILPESFQKYSKSHSNAFQNYLKSFGHQNNKFGFQHEPKPEHAWSCECAAAVAAAAAAGAWLMSVWLMPWPIPWLDQGHGQCPGQCLDLAKALASGALQMPLTLKNKHLKGFKRFLKGLSKQV